MFRWSMMPYIRRGRHKRSRKEDGEHMISRTGQVRPCGGVQIDEGRSVYIEKSGWRYKTDSESEVHAE